LPVRDLKLIDFFTKGRNNRMKKFAKVTLAVLIFLIICAFITTNMLTPGAKTKTAYAGKTTRKAPQTTNGRDSVTYNNVKPNVFNCMKQKLTAAGVQAPQGNEGDLEGYGTKVHFKWDAVTNLTITIKDKPWYISRETITGKIHDFVHACGGN
jgi:hypothetical protein